MLRTFHVWAGGVKHSILGRDLRDACAQVGNLGPSYIPIAATEPNEVDRAAARSSEIALEAALRERGWRPSEN